MFGTATFTLPAGLTDLPAGPQLAAALAEVDLGALSGHDRVTVLVLHERLASHYAARASADMVAIHTAGAADPDDPLEAEDAFTSAAAEIRLALRLTRYTANRRLGFALDVAQRVPMVWDAWVAGRIDERRADIIAGDTLHLDDPAARAVADVAVEEAPRMTTGQLRARLRELAMLADQDAAARRYREAVAERKVVADENPAGTANLTGMDLPPHETAAAARYINRLARSLKRAGEDRNLDQLRADVFLDLLRGRTPTPHQPGTADGQDVRTAGNPAGGAAAATAAGAAGDAAAGTVAGEAAGAATGQGGTGGNPGGNAGGSVDLRVDLATLAELNDHPGDLGGYGPIVADIARHIADTSPDAEWRWAVCHPDSGQPLHVGTTKRRPTAHQRRQVLARQPTCAFPGCRHPATGCDLDHRTPWSETHHTCSDCLDPLCRGDHGIRHLPGWMYQLQPDGDHLWTTRLGHTYTTSGRAP